MQKNDVYQQVTDKIVAELEKGAAPWIKSWAEKPPCNAASNRPYSGVNILLLWMAADKGGYASQRWLTFKQVSAAGGRVLKSARGTHIVFRATIEKESANDRGEIETTYIPVMRGFTVFNVEQCNGLPEHYTATQTKADDDAPLYEFLAKTGAKYAYGGDEACYIPSIDKIHMPERDAFRSKHCFWATWFHELVHWTGSDTRLKRKFGSRFGDAAYAAEELVAELGAAYLCAEMGIENKELRHAGYIENWLKCLKADKRAIFTAASAASKAANFLRGIPTAATETAVGDA